MLTAWISDVGKVRSVNEDRAWIGKLAGGATAAIVADGMGGHQAGDVASQLAVEAIREALQTAATSLGQEEARLLLRQAVLQANEVVYDMAAQNDRFHNMGTTVVVALLLSTYVIIGHIGDSRAYKLRDGMLSCLTEDHTLVNALAKSGQISREEAENHPRRNVLIRALGTDAQVEVDLRILPWRTGDLLLLCSDGLSNRVTEEQLLETLGADELDLAQKAGQLVALALEAGGEDNITVVLLQDAAGAGEESEGVNEA